MSVTKQVRDLNVGQTILIESDNKTTALNNTKRLNLGQRLPKELQGWKFDIETFTGVSLRGGDIIYINKVTRTK